VDLNSYAELAVRLVNTAGGGGEDGDRLVNLDGLRALVADREHLKTGMTRNDLDALRALRAEFRAFFVACAAGDGEDAAAQLNTLLIQHPVHPQLSGHDGQSWHVHYTESGSVADKYAAGAVMGLAVRLTDLGIDRFGVCQAPGCLGVFIDISTSNTRRYCSDRCMNRANVSAFRARKRGEDEADTKAPGATVLQNGRDGGTVPPPAPRRGSYEPGAETLVRRYCGIPYCGPACREVIHKRTANR
jgi:predicted RNA-binding Zn ribbon-like protein